MATHRGDGHSFDSGVPYFEADSPDAAAAIAEWQAAGVVAPWNGRIVELTSAGEREVVGGPRYVAVPRMTALARSLVGSLRLATRTRVVGLAREAGTWTLSAEDGSQAKGFDHVVVAIPGEQAAELVAEVAPELASQAMAVESRPCHALLLAFSESLPRRFDGAFVRDSALAWIGCDSSKPGREPGERWVVHAAPEWSLRHFDTDPERVHLTLQRALAERLGVTLPGVEYSHVHRWKFAVPTAPLAIGAFHDPASGLTACGDWCVGGGVMAAWTSGQRAAELLLAGISAC